MALQMKATCEKCHASLVADGEAYVSAMNVRFVSHVPGTWRHGVRIVKASWCADHDASRLLSPIELSSTDR